jgi:hypothetical protein
MTASRWKVSKSLNLDKAESPKAITGKLGGAEHY